MSLTPQMFDAVRQVLQAKGLDHLLTGDNSPQGAPQGGGGGNLFGPPSFQMPSFQMPQPQTNLPNMRMPSILPVDSPPQQGAGGPLPSEAAFGNVRDKRALRDEVYKKLMSLHAPTLKGAQFTKNDIWKALPVIVGLLSGKNGQEFAGGFAGAVMQGKEQEANLLNANNDRQFQQQQNMVGTQAKIADLGVQDAEQDYGQQLNKERYQEQRGDNLLARQEHQKERSEDLTYRGHKDDEAAIDRKAGELIRIVDGLPRPAKPEDVPMYMQTIREVYGALSKLPGHEHYSKLVPPPTAEADLMKALNAEIKAKKDQVIAEAKRKNVEGYETKALQAANGGVGLVAAMNYRLAARELDGDPVKKALMLKAADFFEKNPTMRQQDFEFKVQQDSRNFEYRKANDELNRFKGMKRPLTSSEKARKVAAIQKIQQIEAEGNTPMRPGGPGGPGGGALGPGAITPGGTIPGSFGPSPGTGAPTTVEPTDDEEGDPLYNSDGTRRKTAEGHVYTKADDKRFNDLQDKIGDKEIEIAAAQSVVNDPKASEKDRETKQGVIKDTESAIAEMKRQANLLRPDTYKDSGGNFFTRTAEAAAKIKVPTRSPSQGSSGLDASTLKRLANKAIRDGADRKKVMKRLQEQLAGLSG